MGTVRGCTSKFNNVIKIRKLKSSCAAKDVLRKEEEHCRLRLCTVGEKLAM